MPVGLMSSIAVDFGHCDVALDAADVVMGVVGFDA
jgi:hypothetical protein